MIAFLRKRPWILLVVLFLIIVVAWIFLITIAVRNQPETIEVETVRLSAPGPSAGPC